jgi:hypothetical protein
MACAHRRTRPAHATLNAVSIRLEERMGRRMGIAKRFVAIASLATLAVIAMSTIGAAPTRAAIINCQPDEVAVWAKGTVRVLPKDGFTNTITAPVAARGVLF